MRTTWDFHSFISSADESAPELCSDILQNGIYLTGGSAALPNLDTMIATEFGVPVSVARDAGECTTLGAGYMADHFDMLGGVSGKND